MSCLQVYDFITGTTITLPHSGRPVPENCGTLDIVRQNDVAAAVVSDHFARICALGIRRDAARRPSKIAAVSC